MEKYTNKAVMLTDINNKFNKQTIDSLFSKIPQVLENLEYYHYRPENKENLSPEHFILNTATDSIKSIHIISNGRGFELSFYRSVKDELSIFMKRFSNYFEIDVGCEEKILDVAKYLTIMLDICEDLTIKNIEFDYDTKYGIFYINECIPQTLRAALDCPLGLSDNKTYHDYLKTIINTMINSAAITFQNIQPESLVAHIPSIPDSIRDKHVLTWQCTWNRYDVQLDFSMHRILTITPLGTLKTKDVDGVQEIDVAFYTRFLLEICKGLGILELKTYFHKSM